jgi:hypothetical protein
VLVEPGRSADVGRRDLDVADLAVADLRGHPPMTVGGSGGRVQTTVLHP